MVETEGEAEGEAEPTEPAELTELRARLHAAAPVFGPRLAALAFARGLAVTAADGSTRPIPITAAPMVLEDTELQRRAGLAAQLSSAGLKAARVALSLPAWRASVLDALSPLERRLAEERGAELAELATTRVDFFGDRKLAALELNATIPAMQGYSDIARETFLDVVGRHAGVADATLARWQGAHRSNALALHRALLAGYQRVRPGRRPASIALLCRRHDAQLTELLHLRDRFRALGTAADVVHPEVLDDRDDAVCFGGQRYDLVYRHLFVRRLEEPGLPNAAALARLFAEENGRRAVLLNPPASPVEVKAVFALLSEAQGDAEVARRLALTDDERDAVDAALPWTRRLAGDALLAQVAAEPDRFVLKRSWDYGGRAVFIGRERDAPSFAARARAAWPDQPPRTWAELCQRAALDVRGGGFVVQERVELHAQDHVLCHGGGVEPARLFVDFSAYASVGLDAEPRWGGVCRGSTSSIVNIVGGGGVLPLLDAAVARELLQALATA